MNSQTSGISSSTQSSFSRGGQFPQEILGEFVEYLTDECHRKDLLNLSLASKNLRTEAQRVLFRSLDYPGPQYCERYYEDMETTSEAMEERPETHRLFLRAVINAPTRLGPHVRTYTSRFFVLVPANSDEHDERPLLQSHDNHWTSHCELWNLTARALPLLTQLKHLTLFLDTDWKGTAEGSGLLSYCATSILRRCSFSLHSFSWVYNNGLLNGADDLAEFLSCQPNLQSLNLSSDPRTVLYADRIPQFQINPGALSRLRRVSGPPSLLLTLLSGRRHINAVTWSNSIYDNNHILNIENWQALQGLKYLSLPDTKILHAICPILSSVETLYVKQVPVHWHEDMSALKHLKSLRVLIMNISRFDPRYIIEIPAHQAQGTFVTNAMQMIAAQAFDACAHTLQSVYFCLSADGKPTHKLFALDDNGQLQMQVQTDDSEIMQHCRPWTPRQLSLWIHVQDYL